VYFKNKIKQFVKILILLLCVLSASYSYGAMGAGYSEYYIPGDELSMWRIFNTLDASGPTTMHCLISMTSWTDNTQVYYDHWENGYNFDPDNPGGTADEIVTLTNAGDVHTFESGNIPTNPRGTNQFYDGGDRIYVAGGGVTVTRSSWIESRGLRVQASAWEIYPVKPQLTTYILPFGENLGFADFSRVFVLIQATEDNTTLTVDLNNDGVPDILNQNRDANWNTSGPGTVTATNGSPLVVGAATTFTTSVSPGQPIRIAGVEYTVLSVTDNTNLMLTANYAGATSGGLTYIAGDGSTIYLQKGQTFLLDSASACSSHAACTTPASNPLNSGTFIQGSATLQVKYVAGVVGAGYIARGFSAFPRGLWTKDYYAPLDQPSVRTTRYTDYYLYNPHSSDITINWESGTGIGSFTINANSTVSFRTATGGSVPVDSGLYFKGSDVFWGVGVGDSGQNLYEWGFSLLPSTMLYDEHFLGWAPDSEPIVTGRTDNGVFLTVAQDNTVVFVDYQNDGVVEQTYTLNRLQTQYITDPFDGSLTGTHFWATGPFTLAYGQDADTATSPGPPAGIDLGYVAIPGQDFISLVLTVDKSVSPQIIPIASGSMATFTIKVNSKQYSIDGITVTDYLPLNWNYTASDTTTITRADGSTVTGGIANPLKTGSNPYTLAWNSTQLTGSVAGHMDENQEITITFTAHTTSAFSIGALSLNQVEAVGTRTVGSPSVIQTFTATDFAYVLHSTSNLSVTKSSDVTTSAYPGDAITYTVTTTNTGSVALTNLSIYDPLPAGVSYITSNVSDNFDSVPVSYTINNGTLNWIAGWVDSQGDGPSAGDIQITGSQLRLTNSGNTNTYTIYRQANLVGTANPVLTFNWNTSGNVDNGEWAYVEIATSAAGPWTQLVSQQNDGSGTVTYAIPLSLRSATTTVQIRTTGYEANEFLYIDNMDISIVHNPPILLDGSAGYTLGVGQSVSIQYRVLVDDPLATGINEITNTASVTSTQTPLPVQASVTDPVINPASATSSVGDFIWLDIDGDGTWDVGEPGIANVEVTLKDIFGTSLQTTTTDSQGKYIFTGVTPATGYYVEVTGGLPSGLIQSSSGRTDDRTNPFALIISEGNNLDKFSARAYNNSNGTVSWTNVWTETDTGGNGATGGNVQVVTAGTPAELRITGGTSAIARSLNIPVDATMATISFNWRTTGIETNDTIVLEISRDGTAYTTLTTFTNLAATSSGISNIDISEYLTASTSIRFRVTGGYTDTANDYFFIDNVNISYSSVVTEYLSADLGYRTNTGTAAVGTVVWSDANSNGVRDAGEPGIAGVTVQLCFDADGDSIWDPGEMTGCSTTTTAADGSYLFTGVTASGTQDYFVYVDGTQSKLIGYTRTTPANDPLYINNLSAGDVVQYANFGYNNPTTYSITDRVWFDNGSGGGIAGNGIQDGTESGIAGVTVALLDASDNVIATTTTGSNGNFQFVGISAGVRYRWRVTDNSGILSDYYGTTSSALSGSFQMPGILTGNVNYITTTPPPHFGYNMTRSIGDTVFNDNGAGGGIAGNGTQDGSEPGISNVTVLLYLDDGDGVFEPGTGTGRDGAPVSSMATDANGKYLFAGLANSTYWVHVDDTQAVLSGYTLTTADNSGVAGHQRTATMSGTTILNIDYGYRAAANRSVTGRIWNDTDNDGLIDNPGESGIAGVTIALLQGGNVINTTSAAADGTYSFNGLPSGNYTVQITDSNGVLSGYIGTYEKTEGTTSPFNSQEIIDLTAGNQTLVNFGYVIPVVPTHVVLSSFSAYVIDGQVVVEWETAFEHNTLGFYLMRLDTAAGKYLSVSQGLLPGLITDPRGGVYSLIDRGAFPGGTYQYTLVEVERDGRQIVYGPFSVSAKVKDDAGLYSIRMRSAKVDDAGSPHQPADYSRRAKQQSAAQDSLMQARKLSEKSTSTLQMNQSAVVKGSRIKIPVAEESLYYMDASDISAITGMSTAMIKNFIGMGQIAVSNQGQPVAYLPAKANAGIYFYGTGTDSVYTRDNVYWINIGRGTSMKTEKGAAPVYPGPDITFTESIHIEQDLMRNTIQTNNPAEDYWDWSLIYLSAGYSDGPKSFKFFVNGKADTQTTATLKINLVGGSDSGINPDHHVVVNLNSQKIGEGWWGGLKPYTLTATFNQSLINEGENTIEVVGLLDDIPYSMFLIDSFDLNYERLYEAEDNRLFFAGDGNQNVSISGFTTTTPDILLLNVTEPRMPKLNTSATVTGSTGNFGIMFKPFSPDARYLAVARDSATKVGNAVGVNPSNLKTRYNMADYLVIVPSELRAAVQPLADYRKAQGMRTLVVKLDEIFNEFNFGISSPEAIKQFLTYAYKNWTRPPKYVVLAGVGTWDYRDNKGKGGNLIPPAVVPTVYGLSTSDNYFADVNGDHVPEMAIGRLPVLTPEELQTLIAKIKKFEATAGNRVILVADDPDDGGKFPVDSDIIAHLFPSNYLLEKVYLDLDKYPSVDDARVPLLSYLNSGAVFFNYIGHGSFDTLAMLDDEDLLTSDDMASLTNKTNLPIVTAMTCLAGEFAIPGYPTISQVMLLNTGGGAAAFWSATGLSDNAEAHILNREFYNAIFNSGKRVLGDAVLQALEQYRMIGYLPFMMDIYTILGDPALRIK
jgi:uncharacterized repeat protein (TIGR01451 family)